MEPHNLILNRGWRYHCS